MNTKPFLKSCLIVALALSLCAPIFAFAKDQQKPAGPPATPVSAITLKTTAIQHSQEVPGRTTAYKVSEIRPQVTGIVTKRLFVEGSDVKKGQQLYQIDPAVYQALYNSAKADLQKAKANYESVHAKEVRYAELVKVNAVSKQAYDDIKASTLQAIADIAVAQAALATAKINLEYTKVYAPISGHIGISTITEGALVTANQTDLLAQITQLHPIYIDMQESRKRTLTLRQKSKNIDVIKVELQLEDSSDYYEHTGTLQFSEVTVDPTTSSVEMRALFPNPDNFLFPGLFVRAKLLLNKEEVLLIPQPAAIRGPGGSVTAWKIDKNNQAQPVPITVGDSYGTDWIVTQGLAAGDTIITSGFQKIRPGSTVVVTPGK